ncbi:methyltransferase-domain-containing protein [Pelagophyceae sp. CCMP2097]|nr:methyltransferase-domain-containing protein [Pelagophyceae sp. CCMP2097]
MAKKQQQGAKAAPAKAQKGVAKASLPAKSLVKSGKGGPAGKGASKAGSPGKGKGDAKAGKGQAQAGKGDAKAGKGDAKKGDAAKGGKGKGGKGAASAPQPPRGAPGSSKKAMTLQEKMQAKLHGAQFRALNEELYTHSGDANFKRFSSEPTLADAYHRGFREQAKSWPENPLDAMIANLSKKAKCVVADFGCGDARLAAELEKVHTVHSFDLVAANKNVVACNMARTPLAEASVDVAVFCLALMGPSLWDFLREAFRVLKVGASLKIAEVRSRFDEQAGGLATFTAAVKALGFDLIGSDLKNKIFVAFDFTKSKRSPDDAKVAALKFEFKACLYKRR